MKIEKPQRQRQWIPFFSQTCSSTHWHQNINPAQNESKSFILCVAQRLKSTEILTPVAHKMFAVVFFLTCQNKPVPNIEAAL